MYVCACARGKEQTEAPILLLPSLRVRGVSLCVVCVLCQFERVLGVTQYLSLPAQSGAKSNEFSKTNPENSFKGGLGRVGGVGGGVE